MDKQKFTIDERFAFLNIYKKCVYCNRPLCELSDMQIDHLLPQSLFLKYDYFQKTLQEYDLPNDYDVNAYYNLVACCSSCNLKKGSKIQKIVNPINLRLAYDNSFKIEKFINKLRKKIILQNQEQTTTLPFKFRFRSKEVRGPKGKAALMDLYDLPVYMGNDTTENLVLDGFKDEFLTKKLTVNTVFEYNEALNAGWYPGSNTSIKMSSWFEEARTFLYALEHAKLPKIAFFSDSDFSLQNISRLSAILGRPSWVPENDIRIKFQDNTSLQDLFKAYSNIEIIESNYEKLHFELEFSGFVYNELLRGDFTGQGCEEIFCTLYEYAVGGTLGFLRPVLLQTTSRLSLVKYSEFDMSLDNLVI